jgi:hypothetical protein
VPATATAPATIQVWINASNANNGLVVRTDDSSISGLLIGGAGKAANAAGTLAADDGDGIKVVGDRDRVRGNDIGTHQPIAMPPSFLEGTVGDGIDVNGKDNDVGSAAAEDRNVVAASGLYYGNSDAYGVRVAGGDNNVRGNTIGTDPGVTDGQIGNLGGGVIVASGSNNRVGGSVAGAGNLIAANGGEAVDLAGKSAQTDVLGNTIGTDAANVQDLTNGHGIVVEAGSKLNHIGNTNPGAGNLVAYTLEDAGIVINGALNTVQQNIVGTNAAQTAALPNNGGIAVVGDTNVIGGDSANAGNVVSGNTAFGIMIADGGDPKAGVGNVVWGNHIGTDVTNTNVLGNVADSRRGDGVLIQGGDYTQVGGAGGNGFKPNVIANNAGAGVGVAKGVHNAILRNRIYDNTGLGIDLQDDGTVLANDAGDGDAGPDGLQNYPLITSVTTPPLLGATRVAWDASSFLTDPTESTELDFYKSNTCGPLGSGDGRTFIGSALIGPGGLPGVDTTAMALRVRSGEYVSATATSGVNLPSDPGRTSEFSPCFLVP